MATKKSPYYSEKKSVKKKNYENIIQEVFKKIELSEKEYRMIESSLKKFKKNLNSKIRKLGLSADIFEGGSYAKKTLIKKNKYDVDLFIRFGRKHSGEDISLLTQKIMNGIKNKKIVHGSRDYFKVHISPELTIEVVPVMKISGPEEAINITDLSYSHVNYINKKVKLKKILRDIKLAKAFCYGIKVYGAESYISGFSGYALELLVYQFRGFLNFLRKMSSEKKEKMIIDIENHYRRKKDILLDINSSKLNSPVILIDPTYKKRNVLAALSNETFKKFKKEAKSFLKRPCIKFFEDEKFDFGKIRKNVRKKDDFVFLEIKTDRQLGDIAGSKILKFVRHLSGEIAPFFLLKKKGFEYNQDDSAYSFFIVKKKPGVIFKGPYISDSKNSKEFRKKHKNIFIRNNRLYAEEKNYDTLKEFLGKWKRENRHKIKSMGVTELNIFK